MYSPSIWPGLPPPKAPNSRTSLTLVNRHTSILHILAPFAAPLKQGAMLIGMLNLRRLRALEITFERCLAAAKLAAARYPGMTSGLPVTREKSQVCRARIAAFSGALVQTAIRYDFESATPADVMLQRKSFEFR